MKLIPLGDRIAVKAAPAESVSAGGIVLPEVAQESTQRGTVVAVGDGAYGPDGELRPLRLAEGDEVLYSKYGGTEVTVEGDEVLVLRESDVLAKVG